MREGFESGPSEKPETRQWMMHPRPEHVKKRIAERDAEAKKHSADEVERLTAQITPPMKRGERAQKHLKEAHELRNRALARTETTAEVDLQPETTEDVDPAKYDRIGRMTVGRMLREEREGGLRPDKVGRQSAAEIHAARAARLAARGRPHRVGGGTPEWLHKENPAVTLSEGHLGRVPQFPQYLDEQGYLKKGTSADTLRPLASKIVESIRWLKNWLLPPPEREIIAYALEGDMELVEVVTKSAYRQLRDSVPRDQKLWLEHARVGIARMRHYLHESKVAEMAKGSEANQARLRHVEATGRVVDEKEAELEQLRAQMGL